MRLSFLRVYEPVRLGGRSVRVGPFGVRCIGGHKYTVGPASFLAVLQFGGLLAAEGLLCLIDHEPINWPVETLRAVAPLMVGGPIRSADLRRATPPQLRALASAFCDANDWERISDGMRPGEGKAEDRDAFDIGMVGIGKAFGIWPYEVLRMPYVEVEAVIEAMRVAGGGVTKDTAEFVKAKQAELDAERARADEKLRAMGVPVA